MVYSESYLKEIKHTHAYIEFPEYVNIIPSKDETVYRLLVALIFSKRLNVGTDREDVVGIKTLLSI